MYILKLLQAVTGISRKDISSNTEISLQYINELFCGKKDNPSINILKKLALYFEIDSGTLSMLYHMNQNKVKEIVMNIFKDYYTNSLKDESL